MRDGAVDVGWNGYGDSAKRQTTQHFKVLFFAQEHAFFVV